MRSECGLLILAPTHHFVSIELEFDLAVGLYHCVQPVDIADAYITVSLDYVRPAKAADTSG